MRCRLWRNNLLVIASPEILTHHSMHSSPKPPCDPTSPLSVREDFGPSRNLLRQHRQFVINLIPAPSLSEGKDQSVTTNASAASNQTRNRTLQRTGSQFAKLGMQARTVLAREGHAMQLLCKKPGLITLNDGVARALRLGKFGSRSESGDALQGFRVYLRLTCWPQTAAC